MGIIVIRLICSDVSYSKRGGLEFFLFEDQLELLEKFWNLIKVNIVNIGVVVFMKQVDFYVF